MTILYSVFAVLLSFAAGYITGSLRRGAIEETRAVDLSMRLIAAQSKLHSVESEVARIKKET